MALSKSGKSNAPTPTGDGTVWSGNTPILMRGGKQIGLDWNALKEKNRERRLWEAKEERRITEETLAAKGVRRLKKSATVTVPIETEKKRIKK